MRASPPRAGVFERRALNGDSRTVSLRSGDQNLEAYLARPEGEGPFPGVAVIHEAFGLNDDIKRIANRFTGEGYVALTIDLFAGRNRALCMTPFVTGMLLRPFDNGGIWDLKSALSVPAEQPGVDGERLGAIGFCLGGGFAMAWACTDERLRVVVPFYGMNPRPLEAVSRACPVVGSYPEKGFIARAGRKFAAAVERHGVPRDIKIYPGSTPAPATRSSTTSQETTTRPPPKIPGAGPWRSLETRSAEEAPRSVRSRRRNLRERGRTPFADKLLTKMHFQNL